MKKIILFLMSIGVFITLTACGATTHTVTFDTDGGTLIEDREVESGSQVRRPSDPVKDGYRFSEWQLNSNTFDFNTSINEDITLKAKYTSTSTDVPGNTNFTVNFITNTDETIPSVTVTSEDTLVEPTISKDGYTLFGWKIVGTSSYFNFATDKVNANMTLEAVWEFIPSVDIDTLDLFISELYENNKVYTDRYIEIYNPTSKEISLTGYQLKSAYNNASLESASKTLNLDKYTIPAKACLVIYDTKASESFLSSLMTSNAISSDVIIHDADDRYGLYKNDVLIDIVEQVSDTHSAKDSRMTRNFDYSGSATFNAEEWTVLSASDATALDSAGIHKLFSTDLDPIIHQITFDTDGGTPMNSLKVLNNTILSITPPSKTGYELVGWSVNGSPFDISSPITSTMTIKAIWEKINLDNVVLDVFFSEIFETNAATNDRYIEIFNPTEDDIDLSNYVICPEYNATLPTFNSKYKISLEGYVIKAFSTIVIYDELMDKDLVASIPGIKIASANIFHDGNDNYGLFKDGEMIDIIGYLTSDNYHQNLSLRRNELVYGSTVFNHNDWTGYTANTATGMEDAGKHFFKELPTYTVEFNTDGGTNIASLTVTTGSTLTLPTAPTKDGYKFICWMNGATEFDETTAIKTNYVLTAKWEVFVGDMYTVTFDTGEANVVINPQNVYAGDKVICPYPPFYDGYNLVAWTTEDGKGFDFNTIITSDIKLTAVWEAKVFYTVTFETDGSEVDSIVVEHGYKIDKPTTSKYGYTFVEWQLQGSRFDFNSTIESDITLVATWNAITYSPEVIEVDSISSLNSAINTATPGDTIIMKDGTYEMTSSLTINSSGTDFGLLTIKAQTVGGVVFTNQGNIVIKGDYVVLEGFSFKDGSAKSGGYVVEIHAHHVRVTNILIDGYDTATNKSGYIIVKSYATYSEIDNCSFLNKNSPGVLLLIDKYSDDPMFTHVHHNYFYNYTNPDPVEWTNELETIRIGWSGHSQTACYAVIEHNIFELISSETELVSVKSGYNVVRNNLILDCSAAITLRHGNTSLIENNVILNDNISDGNGIRVFDAYHVIRNNYISGIADANSSFNAALVLHNGGNAEGSINGSLNGQWTTNNVLIEANTFVNNEINIALGDEKYSKVPWDITFKNNFVLSQSAAAIRQYDKYIVSKVTYEDEYYYAPTLGLVSDVTPSGVNFFIDLAAANTSEVNGLITHELAGAKGLSIMAHSEVGVKDSTTTAINMTNAHYLAFFNNWPYPLV